MADFNQAYRITRSHEGYYVDDPKDPGGETYAGISRVHHPNWEGWELIDQYKRSIGRKPHYNENLDFIEGLRQAHSRYSKRVFWDVWKGDQVKNQEFANLMFDTYWGASSRATIKKLQQLLGVPADGIVGPVTLGAINNSENLADVYEGLRQWRLSQYQKSSVWDVFGSGWTKRIMSYPSLAISGLAGKTGLTEKQVKMGLFVVMVFIIVAAIVKGGQNG